MKKTPNRRLKFNLAVVSILIISSTFAGCGRQKQQPNPAPQQQAATQEEQASKVPDQLKGIESDIEKIMKVLGAPSVDAKEEKGKGGGQEEEGKQKENAENKKETTPQKGEGEGGQQKQETKQAQGGQQKQETPPSPPPAQDPFVQVTALVNDLHYLWNGYMPQAAKMGANKGLMDNFSNALNTLTNTTVTKNRNNTVMAASNLYAYVPDFYYLYRTKTSPEIKKIRHLTRHSMLNATTGNWQQAEADLNNLKSSWSLFKNTVSKEQQDNANKLDFSIYEYEKVIKEKNQNLADIKGRVTMANIQSLEKAMEEQAEKGK